MNRHRMDWEVSGTHAAFVLATTPVFRGVDPGELQQACVALCEGGAFRHQRRIGRQMAKNGDTLFEQGAFADTMYVVESGRFEVLHNSQDGQPPVHIAWLKQGDIFGEAVVAHQRQRSATVKAVADSVVLVIHEDGIRELMKQFPAISTALLRLMLERQTELNAIATAFRRSL